MGSSAPGTRACGVGVVGSEIGGSFDPAKSSVRGKLNFPHCSNRSNSINAKRIMANGSPSETHTESQIYLSTRGGDYGVSFWRVQLLRNNALTVPR